jgi:glutamyl-tRNA reductase
MSATPAVAAMRAGERVVDALWAISARAGRVPADQRASLAEALRPSEPGTVLLETCHRAELYGWGEAPGGSAAAALNVAGALPPGTLILRGREAAAHAIGTALGLDSVVVAEDQILFQLRSALDSARRRGGLAPGLGRLFDAALRAGRRGRSWLPARRSTLADVAFATLDWPLLGRDVLVVGAGRMGELAARTAVGDGARVILASRDAGHAVVTAERLGIPTAPFDPGARIADFDSIVLALAGPWAISSQTIGTLAGGRARVLDLSSPSALPASVQAALGERLWSIDDAAAADAAPTESTVRRLRALADSTLDGYVAWCAAQDSRDTARAVAERADEIRGAELDELWRRVPSLPADQREQIERMTERLADRLIREPLSRLGRGGDVPDQAVRELFGL